MKFRRLFFYLPLLVMLAIVAMLVPQTVIASPAISLSPKFGGPGTKVTVSGINFSSYANENISIYFGDTEMTASPVTVPVTGNFQAVFTVPSDVKPGPINVSIRSEGHVVLTQDMFVVLPPSIRLSTLGGVVGTAVQATCYGFTAGKSVSISYEFDNTEIILGSQTADATGGCVISITIPAFSQGQHTLIAQDNYEHTASAQFEVIPSISIDPKSAGVGERVTVSGSGFPADNQITVILNGKIATLATTQSHGNFNGQFDVPAFSAGTYLVTISDNSGEKRWDLLTIVSRISLSSSSGEIGKKVTVSGTGFEINSIVSVEYDDREIAGALTDEKGAFQCELPIPISKAGSHVITATDGTNLMRVSYQMESQPPPAPAPLSPKRFTEVSPIFTFDWEGVYDVSQPLTYTFEISKSGNFTQSVLSKSGLSASQYTLSESEQLLPNRRGTYYYWHVRATDGADNAGQWSTAVPFRVKLENGIPLLAKVVLAALMAVIIILYGILLKRGLRNKPQQKD